jgi:hypothetical protein
MVIVVVIGLKRRAWHADWRYRSSIDFGLRISDFGLGPERPRRSPAPVGPELSGLAFEMKHDDFGQELAMPPVPLKCELDVSPGRVTVMIRIVPQV